VTARSSAVWILVASSLRPGQWTKNLLLFAGLVFGGRLLEPDAVAAASLAFVVFCALSGAGYLLNDVLDRDLDRLHPLKQTRPVASGALSPLTALAAAAVLTLAALSAAAVISGAFALVAFAYAGLLVAYSYVLKNLVIIDVLTIAGGFVLRAIGGALAVAVPFSSWLLVCTTLLALFLGLSKRRHELVLLGDSANSHRRILDEYSPYLLDQMIAVVTASTLIAYAVYATSSETAARLGTRRLGLTIPFVLYGIFRYLYLVHQKRGGGSPAAMLVTDRPLLTCVGLWIATVTILLYSPLGK
jgi:4-hydroxybenzoate polyprenyltransferase